MKKLEKVEKYKKYLPYKKYQSSGSVSLLLFMLDCPDHEWRIQIQKKQKSMKDLLNDRIPLTHYLCFFMIIIFLEF